MQKTTAFLTAEAKFFFAAYQFASTTSTEVLYLQVLLDRLGFAQKKPTTLVYEDNAGTKWGNSFIWGREGAKHIDNSLRKDFPHKVIQKGTMCPVKVLTLAQLAAVILTERLHPQHYHVSGSCGGQSKERKDLDPSGDLCHQEGVGRQGYQVEIRWPLRGVYHRLGPWGANGLSWT
jgi:hypothetical protein